MTDPDAMSTSDTNQVEFVRIRWNSIKNPTKAPIKSETRIRKTADSARLTKSASMSPIVHPSRSPASTVAVPPSARRRRLLPLICTWSHLKWISSQHELAVFPSIYRRVLTSVGQSLNTETEQDSDRDAESGTNRDVGDREMAVIDPFHGWAIETVDDRHSMGGSEVGYELALYTPSLQSITKIRALQPETKRSDQEDNR